MEGLVFDVHRATTSDGPGLRTTIFLKGCPLSCKWCHNPESIGFKNQIEWTEKFCIGCKTCTELCEHINFTADGIKITNCKLCGQCTLECPTSALKFVAKTMSVEQVVNIAIKDKNYFKQFNGGVTISGGEPMAQIDFLYEILVNLKRNDINTAVDTSGYTKKENFDKIFDYTDVFLYDLKILDSEKHKNFTGVPNEIILENFLYLCQRVRENPCKKIWVRTPLIPDATDYQKNICNIAQFIKNNALDVVERYELCSFNNLCQDKYNKLGVKWFYKNQSLLQKTHGIKLVQSATRILGDKVIFSGPTI